MDILFVREHQVVLSKEEPGSIPADGFLWLDATQDEVAADPLAWRAAVERITGVQIFELHLRDAVNLAHPSYFDSTHHYEMLVFRKLALGMELEQIAPGESKHRIPAALTKLQTHPVTFFVMDHALVTVRAQQSRTIEATRKRLLEYQPRELGNSHSSRPPHTAVELALRLLNAMVDQYLQLRQPLTTQLERWQRALLDPRHPFRDWMALLEARIQLRKLDHLCEEQHDALQEMRDHLVDMQNLHPDNEGARRLQDMMLVRINDVMEHVTRVLNHARRLETSIESAVQIHFSAMAHRTSEIMRTLTVLTAMFMPMTLITGIFGMNFVDMPLLKTSHGFWISIAMMGAIVVCLLYLFRRKRYLEDADLGRQR